MEQNKENKNTSRYEFFICNNPKIYWWLNSIDKPTNTNFLYTMVNSNWIKTTTPNFIDAYTAQIVVDKRDYYNYAKLIDKTTNKTTYWFFNRIDKVLRDAFLYEIKMDVFTSYGYDFLKAVNDRDWFINIKRTSYSPLLLSNSVHNQDDELLPSFNGVYNQEWTVKSVQSQGTYDDLRVNWASGINNGGVYGSMCFFDARDAKFDGEYKVVPDGIIAGLTESDARAYFEPGTLKWMKYSTLPTGQPNLQRALICDVYIDKYGDVLCIPVNPDGTILRKIILSPNVSSTSTTLYQNEFNKTVSQANLDKVKNNPYWINRYKGRFSIPFAYNLFAYAKRNVFIKVHDGTNSSSANCINGFVIRYSNVGFSRGSLIEWNWRQMYYNPIVSKTSTKLNFYLISKFLQYVNNERWCSWIGERFEKLHNFTFNHTVGFTWYKNIDFTTDDRKDIKWNGGETLPVNLDEYQKYISSIQSQRNTNLEIQNRESKLAIAKSILGGISGIVGGGVDGFSKTGSIGGAIAGVVGGGIDAGFSISKAINARKDYIKKDRAHLADKARTSGHQVIQSTNDTSNIFNNLCVSQHKTSDLVGWGDVRKYPLMTLFLKGYGVKDYGIINTANNVIWEFGIKAEIDVNKSLLNNTYKYLNKYLRTDYFDNDGVNDFIYWKWSFNDEYFKQVFPTLDIELIDAIKESVNGELRFWKQGVKYDAQLDLTCYDILDN